MAAEPHRDAYRILQVVPEAHPDVIRAAYYALARIYHPDGDRSDTDLMSDLNWAYDQIRDRVRREAYDRARAAYRQPLGYGQMPVGPGHDDSSRPVAPPPPADRPSEAAGPFARARPTDPAGSKRVADAFRRHFSADRVRETGPAPASEDFGSFGAEWHAPSVFWFVGGTDPDRYAKAKAAGRLNEIPTNHNPHFAPVLHPTLQTGVEAMVVAARAWLVS